MRTHIALTVGPVSCNCYLVYDEGRAECAVIDPGGHDTLILAALERHSLRCTHIFLTHGHFDHILAVPALREHTGAVVVMHREDAPMLTDIRSGFGHLDPARFDRPPDELALGGETYTVGALTFRWLHTPGHTRGSSVLRCGDALYTGDTLFYEECGRCDLPGGDYHTMLRSLYELSQQDGDCAVYPGHDRASTLQHERTHNPYMREGISLYSEKTP